MLRTGKAGSNTAADHIAVIGAGIAQIPAKCRKDLLVRCDGAGASHDLLDWLTEQGQIRGRRLEYSVGCAVTEKIRDAIKVVPAHVWVPASDADGEVREGGDVAELTRLLDLRTWPEGMWVIVRRERPHPGAQLSLFEEADGWRYQAIATNTATGQLPFLEARHRPRQGRGPDPSCQGHRPGTVPLTRVHHQPGLADRHDHRRRRLQIPDTWPWAAAIVAVFANIAAIPPSA